MLRSCKFKPHLKTIIVPPPARLGHPPVAHAPDLLAKARERLMPVTWAPNSNFPAALHLIAANTLVALVTALWHDGLLAESRKE